MSKALSATARLGGAVKQNDVRPLKRQNQVTLHECFPFASKTAGNTVSRKRVFITNSSDEDDVDDNKSSSVKIGSKEMPISLDDESESDDDDDDAGGDSRRLGNKKQRPSTPTMDASSERETPASERKVAAATSTTIVQPHSFPIDESESGDDGTDDEASSPTHAHAHQNPFARNPWTHFQDSDEDDSGSVDDCVREVEEFEANNLTIKGPYTFDEFEEMWKEVEVNLGETTLSIEQGRLIRGANSKMTVEDSDVQSKAQYGRLLPVATNKLLTKIFDLKETDVFVDFGHGIGNACLQAAYTIGCQARGIEVVPDRHFVAQQFCADLARLNEIRFKKDSVLHKVGYVDLREGSLEASSHRKFLTQDITAAFVNNFNGVFRERSSEKPLLRFLDDYLAGLFALMSPGARLISLHPLPLCLSRKDANQRRGRFELAASDDASFFEFEEMDLDEARLSVSWSEFGGNKKMIKLFKYTRVRQSVDHSVFLCCNPKCENAKNAVPIDATIENSDGRVVLNKCACGYEACNLRTRVVKKPDEAGKKSNEAGKKSDEVGKKSNEEVSLKKC